MKKLYAIISIIFAAVALLFVSCEQDELGPHFSDGVPPQAVTEVTVLNQPGGALISYKIPDEKDLLQVEAKYTQDDGTVAYLRSSVFKNKIEIKGLRNTQPQQVELVAIDKGLNRSAPVVVSIEPTTAPIDLMLQSMKAHSDWGGVKLTFDNQAGNLFEIQLVVDSVIDGRPIPVFNQSVFVENPEKNAHTFRAFEPVEQEFKFVVVDRYDNVSDTLKQLISPREEIQFDVSLFKRNIFEGYDGHVLDSWGGGDHFVDKLWDGKLGLPCCSMHTTDGNIPFRPALPPYTTPNLIAFTINLGQRVNISRISMINAQNFDGNFWTRGNPRKFEMWGVDAIEEDGVVRPDLPEESRDGSSFEGWTRLIANAEQIKPSGLPYGQESAQDRKVAEDGQSFDSDFQTDPMPTVQYIRFIVTETWQGGPPKWVYLGELEVFGQVVE